MNFAVGATTLHLFWEADDAFVGFTQEDVDAYEENLEFVTWMTEQPIDSVQFLKGLEIRSLLPKLI